MILFIKGFIIGIGKIIPGVSGALLAINFNVYEKIIESVIFFFNDWKSNLKFLVKLGTGIIISIILCSKIILYLLDNYKFITMMFFLGLICGSTYNFSNKIKFNFKNILIVIFIFFIFFFLNIKGFNNVYKIRHNFIDLIVYFIGGFIEMFSSIIPGLSGTAMLMLFGIYENVILMVSNLFNINFFLDHICLYFSFGLGISVSLILGFYIINKFINKFPKLFSIFVFGLCVYSIFALFIMTISIKVRLIEFILGLMLLIMGLLVGCILDK